MTTPPSPFVSKNFFARRATSLAVAALLTACAVAPALAATLQPKALSAYGTDKSFEAPESAWPTDRWWSAYGDPQLDALIDEALKGSPDLAQAQARVRQADALAQQAGAARAPQVDAVASASEAKQSYNNGVPSAFVPHGWNDSGRAGLNFSYEFDFWGKNRALLASATSSAEAARADAAAARLTVSTAVAAAYADLARLYADRDAAEQALQVRTEAEKLVGDALKEGLETQASAKQAEAATAAADANLAAVDESIGLTRNRIAALLGEGPDRGLSIGRPTPGRTLAFGLPKNLKVELIGRRPDVVAARLRTEAAAKRVKAAKADFYPNVNLTAFLGVQSLGLNMLTKVGSGVGSVGPAVTLPIFNHGRIEGAWRGARAEYDAAVASYDKAVEQALDDVADVAVSSRALDARLTKSRTALEASEQAYRIVQSRYRGGLGTYLDVLTAQDALIANRRAVADLETRAFTLDVALVRALGGGFHAQTQS